MLNRNAIIGICLAFCAIAVGAGWIVAGMSRSPIAAIAMQTPAAQASSSPTAAATSQASAPQIAAGATAQPTAVRTPEATAEATAARPAPTAPTAAPTAPQPAADQGYVEYTIQKGDLLNNIAKQYNVTTKDIIAINQIPNPDSLIVGQVIRIPKK